MNQNFILQTDPATLKTMLNSAEAKLREILGQIENNVPPATIKGTPELNNLFDFNTVYEAKILASKTVGASEGAKGAAKQITLDLLDDLLILKEYLGDKNSITVNDFSVLNQLETARKDSIKRFNEVGRTIASTVIVEGSQPALLETKNYSSDKLLRQITRAVATAANFEQDLTLLFSSLIYEAHKDPRVLPVIPKAFNKEVVQSECFEFARDQNFRDEAGNSLTGLVKKVAQKKDFTLADEDFAKAYNAVVRYLIKLYSSVLSANADFKRTPEEVEQIKKELLSDIKAPQAPKPRTTTGYGAPPAATVKTESIPVKTQPPSTFPTGTATDASVIAKPKTETKPLEFPTGKIANLPTPPRPPRTTTGYGAQTTATNGTMADKRPSKPGEVPVRKMERKAPNKDDLKPIQPIDLL